MSVSVPPRPATSLLRVVPRLLLAASLALCSSGAATAAEQIVVTVTGLGDSAAAAEKDALRRAVRSAVGSYVDSETLVKNDELIRDQILEASGSYVTSWDLVGEPKETDGLYEVEIRAVVEGGQVATKLRAVQIEQSGVNTKDLYGEVVGKTTNAREGAKILKRNVPDDLLESLLVARLVDFEGEPTDRIEPKRQILPDGRVQTTWMVQSYFDTAKFYKEFVPPTHRMLSGLSTAHGGPVMSVGEQVVGLPGNGYPLHIGRDWKGATPTPPAGDQQHCYVILSTGRSEDGGTERWNWYLLEGADYVRALTKLTQMEKYAEVQLHADFLDADGGVVASSSFSPWEEVVWANRYGRQETQEPAPLFLNVSGTLGEKSKGLPLSQHIAISTRFSPSISGSGIETPSYATQTFFPNARNGVCDMLMRPFTVTFDPQDLRRIATVRFHFSRAASL